MLEQSPGGSPDQQQDLADFLRRYQEDPNSISAEEAARRYRELIQLATPADAAEAHSQIFAGLPPEDRRTLARQFQRAHSDPNSAFDGYQYDDQDQAAAPRSLGLMARQAGQQDGGLLGSLLGEGSPLNSALGKLALAGVAAYLARRVLGGHNQQPGAQGGSGLDIGSILAALSAAQNAQGGAQGTPSAGGLDIGSILAALSAAQNAQGGAQGTPSAGGLDIGSILSALGAAQNAQGGAQGTPSAGGLDIGSILSALGAAQNAQGGAQGAKTPDLSALLGDSGNAQGEKTAGGPDLSGLFSEGDRSKKDS